MQKEEWAPEVLDSCVDEQLRNLESNPPQRLTITAEVEEPEYILINDEDDLVNNFQSMIDLTGGDDDSMQRPELRPRASHRRNSSTPAASLTEHRDARLGLVSSGDVVELSEPLEELNRSSFLQVKYIFYTRSSDVVMLRGLPLSRNRYSGQLAKQRNEVCVILNIDADDPRPYEQQGMIDVPLSAVHLKREFQVTNTQYPDHRYWRKPGISDQDAEETGLLTCRWARQNIFKNEASRLSGKKPQEIALVHIDEGTACENKARYTQSDDFIRKRWRNDVIDLEDGTDDDEDDIMVIDPTAQNMPKYSFADMFCGAGGASQGAKEAGFDVLFSCDNMKAACETYRLNHTKTRLYEMDVFDFINHVPAPSLPSVDIMHLSPPCQPYSPAHTIPGQNDETNIAALFACREVINKCRPRLLTLEQTFGILHPKSAHYFNALCRIFTSFDYSLRWKVANLLDYGCPSRRRRLVLIGSAPGEPLPPLFPTATHSPANYETVAKILRCVHISTRRNYDPLHRPTPKVCGPSWDPNIPLPRCITTDGGGPANYHPSGDRDFTLRELAALQGFPTNYKFSDTYVKKQIGNAFPAPAVRGIYGFLKEFLRTVDEGRRERKQRRQRQVDEEREREQQRRGRERGQRQGEEGEGDNNDNDNDNSSRASSVTLAAEDDNNERRQEMQQGIVDLTMEDG